jgi:molecular chaperone DnaJ
MTDYYERLGVGREADTDEIKRAYRRLAMEYHPDRNQGSKEAEARFKEVTEAYEVLRDPEKRAAYDRYGAGGVRGAGGGGFEGFDFSDALEIFMRDFGGFGGFEEVFGGRRGGGRGGRQRGQNLRVRLPLTLEEVARGVTKRIRVSVLEPCDDCRGTGGAEGSEPVTCSVCGGSGQERMAQRSVFGQFVSVTPCRRCGGEGKVVERPCPTCMGEGLTRREREVEVEVPAGVSSENYLTLRGSGNAGPRGGPPGDLLVLFDVADDPRFLREGADLLHELRVTLAQAALGSEVDVPTVDEPARVTIPAGTQSGTVLRLRGLGLPDLNGRRRGDLLVRVILWTPERLSGDQEELFRRLLELEDAPPSAAREAEERKGFWSRVKEAFTP